MRPFFLSIPILGSILFLSISGLAQGKLEFRKSAHNYGEIPEMAGPQRAYFSFKNTGNLPVKISSVMASCGCTTPEWTKQPINPGDTGVVVAEFHPRGRAGIFSKTLTVYSDAEGGSIPLKITGKVLERPLSPEDTYTDTLGADLRMVTRYVTMGMTSPTKGSREDYFKLYNPTDKPITVGVDSKLPKGMTIRIEPAIIPPKSEATMSITLKGPKRKAYGWLRDDVYLKIAGQTTYRRKLEVSATLEENPRKLSAEEAAKAPRIVAVPSREFKLGRVPPNQTRLMTYEIRNDGKTTLEIYEVQPKRENLSKKSFTRKIRPGKTGKVVVEFHSQELSGDHHQMIAVYSNDPLEPTIQLSARVTVLKE